jgi:hypothetical protein
MNLTEEPREKQFLLEEVTAKLKAMAEEKEKIIMNPHTIWTVADVLELNLAHDKRRKAGLLAHVIYKHTHDGLEPVSLILPETGAESVARYCSDDLWIVRLAVRRAHGGVDCPAPPVDKLSNEDWVNICKECGV